MQTPQPESEAMSSTPVSKHPKIGKKSEDLQRSDWDVIVVGSGIGGMTAAAALAHQGKRVLVIEKHYVAGGFTHTFSRKGYTWDVGVHCLGDLGPDGEIGKFVRWLTDGKLEFEPFGDVYDTFHFPDEAPYEFASRREALMQGLMERFPAEKDKIRTYFKLLKRVMLEIKPMFPLRAMPNGIANFAENRLGLAGMRWRTRTTQDVLNEIGLSEKLYAVLTSQWGYFGTKPSESSFAAHAMVVTHFFKGAYFPVGGAARFAETLLTPVIQAGGDVIIRSPVKKILVRDGRAVGVVLENGRELTAPAVISAAGARFTVDSLLESPPEDWAQEIRTYTASPCHLSMYMGFNEDIRPYGATRSSQWFYNSWEIENITWDLADPQSDARCLFVSFPSVKDPEHPKDQKQTAEVVTFVDWNHFTKWTNSRRGMRPSDYSEFKKEIEERLFQTFKKNMPALAERVAYREMSTPLSTTFFNSSTYQGGIYGLEHTPRRFTSRAFANRSPIPGLYMGGVDAGAGGVSGGLIGGLMAAAAVDWKVFLRLA